MVKSAMRAVASRLAQEPVKQPDRRLLFVIRAADGDLVLQKKHDDHQPRHHYETEARSLLKSLFPRKAEKFCARAKADKAIHDVLDFKRSSDIHTKPHFTRKGIEWHPVVFDIAYIGLTVDAIKTIAKKGGGLKTRTLTPLAGHEFEEKLLKLFPRN